MENGGEIRRDQKRSDWIFRFIPILLIAFVLFFVFKLQGGWDVSSNFGVRTITASRDKGNVQAVIDGDEETVWGDGNYWEKEKAGDYICFFFFRGEGDQKRSIHRGNASGSTPILVSGRRPVERDCGCVPGRGVLCLLRTGVHRGVSDQYRGRGQRKCAGM